MFPWALWLKNRGGGRLSDIEYLSIKDYGTDGTDSKRVDVDDEISISNTTTETDLATATASSGKDMYLAGASWSGTGFSSGSVSFSIKLYVNTVEVEQYKSSLATSTSGDKHTFLTKGVKVAAGDIIKITMKHTATGATVGTVNRSTLILFEEATGESPAIS